MPIKKKAIEKIGTHLADTFPLFLLFIIVDEKRFKLSTNPQKIHKKFREQLWVYRLFFFFFLSFQIFPSKNKVGGREVGPNTKKNWRRNNTLFKECRLENKVDIYIYIRRMGHRKRKKDTITTHRVDRQNRQTLLMNYLWFIIIIVWFSVQM